MGDELLELRVELEEIRKRLTDIAAESSDLSRRAGLVGYRLGELARAGAVASATGTAGLPCTADVVWDETPVGHVEAVPASAMIPPRELNRADRGAE